MCSQPLPHPSKTHPHPRSFLDLLSFPISKSFPYLHPFEWNGFPLCCKMSKLGDDGLADFKMPLRFIGLIFIGDHSGKKETDGGHLWAWAFMRSLARLCLSGLGVSKGVVKWGFRCSVRNEDLVFCLSLFLRLFIKSGRRRWEVVGKYFVVGPLLLISKGQGWCHFSLPGMTLLESQSLTDKSVTSEIITPLRAMK